MILNAKRREALKNEMELCEHRLGALLESFNYVASMLEQQGHAEDACVVRKHGLAHVQALLSLTCELREHFQKPPAGGEGTGVGHLAERFRALKQERARTRGHG